MPALRVVVLWGVLGCLGCVPHSDEPPATAASPTAGSPPPTNAAPPPPPVTPATEPAGAVASVPAPPTTSSDATPAAAAPPGIPPQPAGLPAGAPTGAAAPPPETVRVTAKAGEGLKGQSLKNETGLLVEPAKAYFSVQQRVVFEMEIPKALQLYKALEGRAPQSHDEFMNKIITANQIKLPQLPAGNKYVYDPAREELMVEKPAGK